MTASPFQQQMAIYKAANEDMFGLTVQFWATVIQANPLVAAYNAASAGKEFDFGMHTVRTGQAFSALRSRMDQWGNDKPLPLKLHTGSDSDMPAGTTQG